MALYTLKPGVLFYTIINGEYVQLIGDGKTVQVELSDETAQVWAQKLMPPAEVTEAPVVDETPEVEAPGAGDEADEEAEAPGDEADGDG